METPPPLIPPDQRARDNDQIKLLSIFHFVLAGMMLLGIGFLFLHYTMMHGLFAHPEMWPKDGPQGGPPPEIFENFLRVFVWFYLSAGALLVLGCVLNIVSGLFLRRRQFRTFSLVVAGLDCLQVPFGTALGVFTILILIRDSVRRAYER